jgi:hypothetical protein
LGAIVKYYCTKNINNNNNDKWVGYGIIVVIAERVELYLKKSKKVGCT